MKRTITNIPAAVSILLIFAQAGRCLVNPSLQPNHLYERYNAVLSLRVSEVDYDEHLATLVVTDIAKGTFAPEEVVLSPADEDLAFTFEELMYEDLKIVAFVGKNRRRHETDILFYPGDGRWQVGQLASLEKASRWQWTEDLGLDEMFGTFNGQAERLTEMMADQSAGRYYYPAKAFTQFKEGVVIDTFDGPARGVALYDIDGDGDLDIYACSPEGGRAYLQTQPLKFENSTAKLGLEGCKSVSVNLADTNGDGRIDMLLDDTLLLGNDKGFTKTDHLPASGEGKVWSSAFVELNGDGYPDVVISREQGGLGAYVNPGKAGGTFRDATADFGLDSESCGEGETGFFAPGYWNGDGRTDLFYGAGKGLLLVQNDNGLFEPVKHRLQFDFKTGGESAGLTGAGAFAPLWRPSGLDLVFSSESNVNFVVNIDGRMEEMSCYGNEITEGSFRMLPVVAEDLNADGNVDVYAASRSALPNMFYTNRGYGSFMTPVKYKPEAFPGGTHQKGAWGLAVGDVNSDGANDLLLSGADGRLSLVLNDTLAGRGNSEHPTHHEQKRAQTSIVTVHVKGDRGVLGARVELTNEDGQIVGLRVIGSNVTTGCRGSDTVNLAVREAGQHTLTIHFSDGNVRTWPVDIQDTNQHIVLKTGHN